MEDTPQNRTVRTFEDGAFSHENDDEETDTNDPEITENEQELTEIEREREEPTGSEFAYPLVDDQQTELSLREVGAPRSGPVEIDTQVFQHLYESVGYNADMEDTCSYPLELAGNVDIDVGEEEINVTYEIEKDRIVNLRSPDLRNEVEKDEVAQELTPTENVGVEVYSDDPGMLQVEFLYDREDLAEGSRETADKLEQVEEALTGPYSGR